VGRTGFGNVGQPAADDALLRRAANSDGSAGKPLIGAPFDCAALLATCAQEGTGADSVVRALADAASAWLAKGDAKRLRSALLGIVASLD
jgi:hypothetical protein